MATIHFTTDTTATPEHFVAAVTDFGPGRSQLFGNTDDSQLKVHDSGPDWADVTEGRAQRGSACATTGQTPTASA
jgi:hypothetical protein